MTLQERNGVDSSNVDIDLHPLQYGLLCFRLLHLGSLPKPFKLPSLVENDPDILAGSRKEHKDRKLNSKMFKVFLHE